MVCDFQASGDWKNVVWDNVVWFYNIQMKTLHPILEVAMLG
jgi:hypothetical protein